jgi:hypothetical protein
VVKKMAEMNARYPGKCRSCGGSINAGDRINWIKESGARHVKCPASSPVNTGKVNKVEPDKIYSVPLEKKSTVIKPYYYDGEYLSGYKPGACDDELERLGLAHHVSGWGTHLDDIVVEKLGKEFTLGQAEDFARPKLEAAAKARTDQATRKAEKKAAAFDEARRTGKPVVLSSWSEECDGSTDECNIDNITIHAMPDGSTKKTRDHTW